MSERAGAAPRLGRPWLAAAALLVAGTSSAVLWHWLARRPTSAAPAANAAEPRRAARVPVAAREAGPTVEALLRDGSPGAWQRLVSAYRTGDPNTKLRILQRAAELPALESALGYVLATVGDDPTPLDRDPMIEAAAELLKRRWQEPADLDTGRELMLMQRSEKRRWLMAKAMIAFAKTLPPNSRFSRQKQRLLAKLVDLHSTAHDDFVRREIVNDLPALGDRDLALVLARGPALDPDELDVVQRENAAQAEAARTTNGRAE